MNISKVKILSLTVVFLAAFCAGCAVNPVTGENELMLYGNNVKADIKMGRQAATEIDAQIAEQIQKDHSLRIPQPVSNYVSYVGRKIAAVSHNPDLNWQYKVIPDKTANAFALPGGYIYITTTMLKNLKTEDQLASILAHETAHVTARHAASSMSRDMLISLAVSLATNDKTAKVMKVARTAAQLGQMSYSRKQENQADIYGLDYLYKAGYNPYAMVETMTILEGLSRQRPLEFFSTHPSPPHRREQILQRIHDKGYIYFGDINSKGKNDSANPYYRNVLSYML